MTPPSTRKGICKSWQSKSFKSSSPVAIATKRQSILAPRPALLVSSSANNSVPASEPLLSSLANFLVSATTPVPARNLSLAFNGRLFYTLADVLAHISDYPEGEERVFFYVDIVEQVAKICNLGSAFADGLIKALKKNKSFAIARWSKEKVALLVAPLARQVKADRVGLRCDGALKTINKHCGPEVTGFFRGRSKSEKTLRQLAHLATNCYSYGEARRLVNAHVVERLINGTTRQSKRYETTTGH